MKNNDSGFRQTRQNGTKSQGGRGAPQKDTTKNLLKPQATTPTRKNKHILVSRKAWQDTSVNGR